MPVDARAEMGEDVVAVFAADERAKEEERKRREEARARGETYTAPPPPPQPRVTFRSFQRVCLAIGLHIDERQGATAVRRWASETIGGSVAASGLKRHSALDANAFAAIQAALNPSAAAAAANANAPEPAMTFEDFLALYASFTKTLSPSQEIQEVFRLLDDDLDGRIALPALRQALIGFEAIVPSNDVNDLQASDRFYGPRYKYHYSLLQKVATKEQLIDALLKAHFKDRNIESWDEKIDMQEFADFINT